MSAYTKLLDVIVKLTAKDARIHELEEALRPLADWAGTIYDHQDDDDTKDIWVYIGAIRRAAELLKGGEG